MHQWSRWLVSYPGDHRQGLSVHPRSIFGYWTPSEPAKVPGVTIDVLKTGNDAPVTLTLSRGLAVRGTVRDQDGKPVAGAVVQAKNEDRSFRQSVAITNGEGRYEVVALSPLESSLVTVSGPGSVSWTKMEGDPDHPVANTLWKDLNL